MEKRKTGDQVIWYNSQIRIQNKPFFWPKAFKKGLLKISQLFEQGKLISTKQAEDQYGLNYIELYALFTALPTYLKSVEGGQWQSKYAELLDSHQIARQVYSKLIKEEGLGNQKKNTWEIELNIIWSNKEFCQEVQNIYKVTNIIKYRSFQYRLLFRALVFNTQLYKWGLRENDLCTFCEQSRETYTHVFFYCHKTEQLWRDIKIFVNDLTDEPLHINVKNVILNRIHHRPEHVVNFICLVAKQYIYRKRCENKELKGIELIQHILRLKNTEKYIAIKNNKMYKYDLKWANRSRDSNNIVQDNFIEQYVLNM